MLTGANSRKALNFDLDDNLLKLNYPNHHYKKGWKDISVFLKRNDFDHRQYSGYVSNGNKTYAQVNAIIEKMNTQLPWIKKCVKQFDVTAVLEEYSLLIFFEE